MANVQPILDYSKADAITPWRKQIPGKLLHHFSPTPRFLATALFGKASSKVGRRQRWWNLQLILLSVCQQTWVFLRVKKNMGFFKSQKKLAIKIVFVYSMRISIIHILLFFTVKLSIWSFALKKKCIQINILQSPGILSMLCILRPSTPPWNVLRLFQSSSWSRSRFYNTETLLLDVAYPKRHIFKLKDFFLIHWFGSVHSPRSIW